jgi:hypothetical protein
VEASLSSEQARAELEDNALKGSHGFQFFFELKKKEILWKRYGLDWHMPSELNPNVFFD